GPCSGTCPQVVTFTVTATDNCDGTVTPTCTPASGSSFPSGTTTVTCTAKDSCGNPGMRSFKVTVICPAPLTLACASGGGQVGIAYSSALVASGGVPPYTYSITFGSLPPGLMLNPATGAITGTPTTAGNFAFSATVVDSRGTV